MKKKTTKYIKLFDIKKLRFAIEIEVEFPNSKDSALLIQRNSIIKGWMMDRDGSLDNGVEYRPTNKNHLYWNEDSLTQIKEVLSIIRCHRGKVKESCGLHVHVNAKKLSDRQILEIIREWVHKQRFIMKKFNVSEKRLDEYCKLLPRENLNKISEKQIHKLRNDTYGWNNKYYHYFDSKYYSLNVSHLAKGDYQTLEFRLFGGTLNYKELRERIYFCLNFIKDCIERE